MIQKISSVLMLAVIFSTSAMAQSKDETAITTAVENLRKAMIDADKPALEKLAADDLSYGHSSGAVQDKAAFVEAIVSGKSDFITIELTEQTVKISGNIAIVRHRLSATNNDNGTPGSIKLFVLLIWQKQKGEWKLLARQAVRVPQQ
jgi:ketosteroid isomerase-like protein